MDVKPETGFYTRNNWLKASPFGVEIKIRRFITPILFLLGRDRPQLSTVNCQLSTVNCQLSTVNCQLSTVNCQLSTVNGGYFPPSARHSSSSPPFCEDALALITASRKPKTTKILASVKNSSAQPWSQSTFASDSL